MHLAFTAVPAAARSNFLNGDLCRALSTRTCPHRSSIYIDASRSSRATHPAPHMSEIAPSSAASSTNLRVHDISSEENDKLPARVFGVGLSGDPDAVTLDRRERKTKTRVRQHLNPLAARWRGDVEIRPDFYSTSFANPAQSLVVDIGSGKGRFAERLAEADRTRNLLGLEIRACLVDEGNSRAQMKRLRNLAFLACNANVSLRKVLEHAPSGALSVVLCQFCDPWFKKRHAKRRMVDATLVDVVHDALRRAAEVREGRRIAFVQSDVLPLAEEMRALFDAHPGFQRDLHSDWADGWVKRGPFMERTEREICVESKGNPVYRAMYTLAPMEWEGQEEHKAQANFGTE